MCKEYMYENRVYINDSYVTFNIIELDSTGIPFLVSNSANRRYFVSPLRASHFSISAECSV